MPTFATRGPLRLVAAAANRLLAVDHLNQLYLDATADATGGGFPDRVLRRLQLRYEVCERDIRRIPRDGPVVVVANHPFGGAEGLILASLLESVRPDAKLMANFLLDRVSGLREKLILVDPFNGPSSRATNFRPLREAISWLRKGGMLAVFPAGEVSHLQVGKGGVTDPPWSDTVARIIRLSGATVVPVFFAGSNGPLFQLAGMLHPRLRTALLPKELLNKRQRTITPRVGNPIRFKKLEHMSDEEMIGHLRVRTYHLADRAMPDKIGKAKWKLPLVASLPRPRLEPLIDPVDPAVVAEEIRRLADDRRLCSSGSLEVYYGSARELPQTLREIGRLREQSFRAVEEGTGCALDLDRFDATYLHLFLWDARESRIAGAYRLGRTDEILADSGKKGLYTTTLFRIRKKLLRSIGPALEMGRSFVCPDYQRQLSPLMLLWKGIAAYVARHPRYKTLLGPVTITHEYQSMSKHLLAAFLKRHESLPHLARYVRPRKPMWVDPVSRTKLRKLRNAAADIDDVDQLISDIETKFEGMPVLLRQYLRLGGKLLAFNIDPDFCNVLDGLILVDLTKSDPRILGRYMGPAALAEFLKYHGAELKLVAGEASDG
ncbi:MAG: lysophospholipid acyltransferase family protein [Verrucomicrobia bacterium]|nr:lysophospholipid acyltransferase family protein [Verrucomicrobiota bacterium]